MTNFEKMVKENPETLIKAAASSLCVDNGQAKLCREIGCGDCVFYNKIDCEGRVAEWLRSEYKEPVKMNEQERRFCDMIQDGYLARDADDSICWYGSKPEKGEDGWCADDTCMFVGEYSALSKHLFKAELIFGFVKWEDEEPWSVRELFEMDEG